jgi:hypothetical protein
LSRKRGNGEGTIHRRKGGGWCAQYTVYTDKGRKRKTIYGKTRAEVGGKLAKALSDREDGLLFDSTNLRLGDYLDRWLKDSVRTRCVREPSRDTSRLLDVTLSPPWVP